MPQNATGSTPPAWIFAPVTAWIYLAGVIVLAFTPAFPLNWLLAIIAAVFVYQDLNARGMPTFWWAAAVVVFGALAYVFFVYRRPKPAVVYSPQAAVSQQARMAQGLPPQPVPGHHATQASPAGWYPDPTGDARVRYWDGTRWTEHTAI